MISLKAFGIEQGRQQDLHFANGQHDADEVLGDGGMGELFSDDPLFFAACNKALDGIAEADGQQDDASSGEVLAWLAKILLRIKHCRMRKLPQILKIRTKGSVNEE